MSTTYQSAHSLKKEEIRSGQAVQVEYSFDDRAEYIKKQNGGKTTVQKNARGEYEGVSFDILKDLPEMVQRVEQLRQGDANRAAADISLGEYAAARYNIPVSTKGHGYMDNLLSLLGVHKNQTTLAQLTGKTGMGFTTIPELNKNFEWLIGETIVEAIRSGMMQRGFFRRLVSKMETVPFDSIKVPIIKNPNGFYQELREGETWKVGTMEYDEISVETKDVATAFRFTDRVLRNVRLNILQETLATTNGLNLDIQLTNEAIERLINGNQPGYADAAPIIGVGTPGAFDYDNDWLELVIGMAQLGYQATTVVGSRSMIKEAMALPEFKGSDYADVKAGTQSLVPMPMDYVFMPTGAMPDKGAGGGQLLFLDSRFAMAHYTTKPLTMENQRLIRNLTEEWVLSFTSAFVKEQADASMILDSSVNITANPFPAAFDMQAYERAAGGFKKGF